VNSLSDEKETQLVFNLDDNFDLEEDRISNDEISEESNLQRIGDIYYSQ
jgi:hypothetical protein